MPPHHLGAAVRAAFEPHSSHLDWCEENYAVTPHVRARPTPLTDPSSVPSGLRGRGQVAEFWNSTSGFLLCFPLVPLAAHAFRPMHRHRLRRDGSRSPGLLILWALMAAAGVGSAWFHASLSLAGQLLDELSVIWVIFYGALVIAGDAPGWLGAVYRRAFNWRFLGAYTSGKQAMATPRRRRAKTSSC